MSGKFDINREIEECVDKMCDQLKTRLKKMVDRSEKQAIRNYAAAQKAAGGNSKGKTTKKSNSKKERDESSESGTE